MIPHLSRRLSNKSIKKHCFAIWAKIVKLRDNNQCFMCGSKENLNSHHLITRRWIKTAFKSENGITLCAGCHDFRITSVHTAPWFTEERIKEKRPDQYKKYIKNREEVKDGTQAKLDYTEVLYELLLEHDSMVQDDEKLLKSYFQFTIEEEKEIFKESSEVKTKELSKKWGGTEPLIKTIIKDIKKQDGN